MPCRLHHLLRCQHFRLLRLCSGLLLGKRWLQALQGPVLDLHLKLSVYSLRCWVQALGHHLRAQLQLPLPDLLSH